LVALRLGHGAHALGGEVEGKAPAWRSSARSACSGCGRQKPGIRRSAITISGSAQAFASTGSASRSPGRAISSTKAPPAMHRGNAADIIVALRTGPCVERGFLLCHSRGFKHGGARAAPIAHGTQYQRVRALPSHALAALLPDTFPHEPMTWILESLEAHGGSVHAHRHVWRDRYIYPRKSGATSYPARYMEDVYLSGYIAG